MQLTRGAKIGIVGVPPLEIIRRLVQQQVEIIDLDEPRLKASLDLTEPFIPRVYCAVLRTVVLNGLHLPLARIYIDVGPGKCDCALHVARVLEDLLDIPVIRTRNQDQQGLGTPLCRTRMPLIDKMSAITRGVACPLPAEDVPACRPTAGFWGVPPRDFSLLRPFPETTHVYGWTRCMENKTPADLALECYVNPEVPTVFFAQSFCAKNALAKHLARQHPCGLYLDCDATVSASARAKVEAFLELAGVRLDSEREIR